MIRLEDVYLTLGDQLILKGITLQIEKGGTGVILGASGSGKTTILRVVLGLYKVDSGRVFVDGEDITSLEEEDLYRVRAKIGMVFQGGALFDSMTVGENVGYRLFEEGRLSQDEIEEIVREKLRFVGVEPALDLYPAELSGGMKKRVAIARALAADPDYIFFDEPTTGLDPIGVYNICNLMLRLQQEGKTILMVTHDMQTAFAVSKRFSFIHNSRLIFEGTKEELTAARTQETREFFAPTEKSLFTYNNKTESEGP